MEPRARTAGVGRRNTTRRLLLRGIVVEGVLTAQIRSTTISNPDIYFYLVTAQWIRSTSFSLSFCFCTASQVFVDSQVNFYTKLRNQLHRLSLSAVPEQLINFHNVLPVPSPAGRAQLNVVDVEVLVCAQAWLVKDMRATQQHHSTASTSVAIVTTISLLARIRHTFIRLSVQFAKTNSAVVVTTCPCRLQNPFPERGIVL